MFLRSTTDDDVGFYATYNSYTASVTVEDKDYYGKEQRAALCGQKEQREHDKNNKTKTNDKHIWILRIEPFDNKYLI